jgi:hypothetical protein
MKILKTLQFILMFFLLMNFKDAVGNSLPISPTSKYSVRFVIDKGGRFYEFLDEKGKVVKRYEEEKSLKHVKNGVTHHVEQTMWPGPNGFYVWNEADSFAGTKDGEIIHNNHIKVFDLGLNLVFEKSSVPYHFSNISENGKSVLCVEDPPDEGDPYSKEGMYIFVDGNLVLQKPKESSEGKFSPSGKWFAYGGFRVGFGQGLVLINLETKKERFVSFDSSIAKSKHLSTFNYVDDLGNVGILDEVEDGVKTHKRPGMENLQSGVFHVLYNQRE